MRYNEFKVNSQYIVIVVLSVIAMTSCDLDQYPYSEVAADDYVTDSESVNTLVLGCYNGLHDVMYYEWALTELRSDNARMYGNNSTSSSTKLVEQLDQNTVGSEHEWVETYWNAAYAVIARCNNVLAYTDVVDDVTERNRYEGEAMFLRSLQYFNLVRLWGPLFLVTGKTTPEEARNMQRSSVEEIYAQIEGDLEEIVSNGMLPETVDDDDLGRADLNAAKALLAKVYATHYEVGDEKYGTAISLCREVLESDNVGNPSSADHLVAYDEIFSIDNEMNREIVFTVRYLSGNVSLGSPFGNLFAPLNNGGNVIIGTCSHYNRPSDNLISAYVNEGDEIRLNTNIAQSYYNSSTEVTVEAVYCTKYTTTVTTQYDGESDWPIIRVGDIALLYAELSNELNGPSEDALKYLNMIRGRAGLDAYSLETLNNTYDFREAVRSERRMELAFENQRWFDLMRWGIAVSTVNSFYTSESFYSAYSYTVNSIEEWQTLLPIPVSIINVNSDVAQNVGY